MSTNKTELGLKVCIGVLLVALAGVIAGAFREKVVTVGDKAPDFTITTDSGKQISRSGFGGRLLVLNFWATWCPPCLEELPSLVEFQKRLAASGVVVLGVSVDTNEQEYRAFLQKAGVSFLTARDPSASISSEYGTFKYPETYVIDANGRVLQKHIGAMLWTDDKLIREIQSFL
jgi:cytochrome c biogenesis protein CcmG, thiol:disulfide interchange protein DsbE